MAAKFGERKADGRTGTGLAELRKTRGSGDQPRGGRISITGSLWQAGGQQEAGVKIQKDPLSLCKARVGLALACGETGWGGGGGGQRSGTRLRDRKAQQSPGGEALY